MFGRNPLNEPGAIQLTADDLAKRFGAGEQFRLVCLPYQLPRFFPPKEGDHWPLLTEVSHDTGRGRAVVIIVTKGQDDAHQARPQDHVIVIPA
jgi:hypothetical protein